MNVLEVKDLNKKYDTFQLEHVNFSVRENTIMGFIGRNGAGKTTTLKSLLNQIHPDAGEITFFGMNFEEGELDIKKQIGFVSGGVNFYPKKSIKSITGITKGFYDTWDNEVYQRYLKLFELEERKKPLELSEGMKVKYALTLALSHHARFLILDEPTSGLDPVSRDELLEVFLDLVEKEGVTILFSTHITSDLDKCANDITYIKKGKIVASTTVDKFCADYRQIKGREECLPTEIREKLIGCRVHNGEFNATAYAGDVTPFWQEQEGISISSATMEDIMVHLER